MKKKTKRIITIIIIFFLIILAFIGFAIKLSKISVPPEFVEYRVHFINDTSYIYENIYGVPHIIARNEQDLFFLIGYIHSRDRLWQMDINRRTAFGKLSEVFGKSSISLDKYLRGFQFYKQCQNIYNKLDENIKNLLQSYSKGVNFYIEECRHHFPFEFAVLDYEPEKWEPIDCIGINKLIALKFSSGFINDLIMGEIADKIGGAKALKLISKYPENATCVLDDSLIAGRITIPLKDSLNKASEFKTLKQEDQIINYSQLISIMQQVHNNPNACGSNTWARKKTNSIKAGAVLACDPHLELSLPAFWYEMHITCPTINAVGLSVPGIPTIYVGRNDYIAWGNAQSLIDDCDLFFEKVSNDSTLYQDFGGKQEKFKKLYDTIRVRNSENYIYRLIQTNRSAIISFDSSISMVNEKLKEFPYLSKYYLTYLWTGSYYSDEISSGYKLLKARDWQQFKQAFNNWGSPSLVFSYADINGNIGVLPVGYIPIRNKECNNMIPNPGWVVDYSWNGYQKATSLGELYNPKKRYVTSANHKITRSYGMDIPGYWASPSRAIRLDSLLIQYYEYTSRDAQLMLMDVYSPFAYKISSIIITYLDTMKQSFSLNELNAYEKLHEWDCFYRSNSIGATIFSEFLDYFIKNTFYDEVGETLYEDFTRLSNLGLNKIYEIINVDTLTFFDDIRTPKIETKKEIIYRSFVDAVISLTTKFNTDDINKWHYGKLHLLEIDHLLGSKKFLKPVLSFDAVENKGSITTLNYSERGYQNSNRIKYGVSGRFVADMEDTTVYMVLPAGNSGHPHSENYSNQFQLWITGNYVTISTSRVPSPRFRQTAVFYPKR